MKKYDYVEDYLEVIAGLRDPHSLKQPSVMSWFNPIINLARYDVPVVNNMSEATLSGDALTQRQAELAVMIVAKYQRQLAALGIDARKENLSAFRQPFRIIDDVKQVDVDENEIIVKFHYDRSMIDELREFSKESQGVCAWDADRRVWYMDLTEYNINWAVAWAQLRGFDVTHRARCYYDLVVDAGKTPYRIELKNTDCGLTITNANESMLAHIKDHIGDLCIDNVVELVDHSPIMGYSVDDEIIDKFSNKFGKTLLALMLNKECQQDYNELDSTFKLIKDYASVTKRYPIVIYEPDLSNRLLDAASKVFGVDDIAVVGNSNKNKNFMPDIRVLHSIRPVTQHRIPLLITSAGMITGGERQMMLQNSEKVVFFSAGVYNSKKKTQVSHL